jgi:hypothetical protein
MPVPVFVKTTAVCPAAAGNDAPFAPIGADARNYLHLFGSRNWLVFSAILLRTNREGFAAVSLPEIARDTGLERETVQRAIRELISLSIGGKSVLSASRSGLFEVTTYIVFPDVYDKKRVSIMSQFSDSAPGRAAAPSSPPRREMPLMPDEPYPDEDAPYAPEPVSPPAGSGKKPLPEPATVAGKSRYDEPATVAGKSRYIGEGPNIGEDNTKEKPLAASRQSDVKPEKKKPSPPVRNPENPENAPDLIALFITLYRAKYNREPVTNLGAFGKRMKAFISAVGVERTAKVIHFYFEPRTPFTIGRFRDKGHSAGWFMSAFDEVNALTDRDGTPDDNRKTGLDKLRAETEGTEDFLPASLRALCDEEEPETEYDSLFTNGKTYAA